MGDGWETRRSREKGHLDWAIIKLSVTCLCSRPNLTFCALHSGAPGHLSHVEIDTAHFKGNFPESCELHALRSDDIVPDAAHADWTPILTRTKLGPHRQHHLQLDGVTDQEFTHVKLTIHPDGGESSSIKAQARE
jgi:allantoicase